MDDFDGKSRTPNERIKRDDYFIQLAEAASTRSTCPRLHVGAILVRRKSVISTGYNGAPKGLPHCDDIGCLMKEDHCIRTIHAETNCVLQALEHSLNIEDSTLYVTDFPCFNCLKLLYQAGVIRIVYKKDYDDGLNKVFAREVGFAIKQVGGIV